MIPSYLYSKLARRPTASWPRNTSMWVLVDLVYGTAAFELLRRFVSLPTLVSHIASPRPRPTAVDVDEAVRVVKGVLHRLYRRDYCLPQSLVLCRILSRTGHQPRLMMGVRRSGPGLDGHAWVVLDGQALAERDDPVGAFATTFQFPLTTSP